MSVSVSLEVIWRERPTQEWLNLAQKNRQPHKVVIYRDFLTLIWICLHWLLDSSCHYIQMIIECRFGFVLFLQNTMQMAGLETHSSN